MESRQMTEAAVYSYWLYSIRGLGNRSIWKLYSAWAADKENAGKCFGGRFAGEKEEEKTVFAETIYRMDTAALKELCCLAWGEDCREEARNEKRLQAILESRMDEKILQRRKRELQEFADRGIILYSMEDPAYPERLRRIPDPPYGLFVRGKFPDPVRPSVAIIGARMASAYGREQARRFAGELAQSGIQIVSGMARGIDGIAERAAFEAGGISFAVLGSGVDVCYPMENQNLYEKTIQDGGVISEYLPGTQPVARYFPARNRIISGLADALLVIEARAHSGTLITVDMALEQGREVFALPGRVSDALSFGCNRLIRQGAGIAMEPGDLLDYFYGIRKESGAGKERTESGHASCRNARCHKKEAYPLSEMEKLLYDIMDPLDAQNLDAIAEAAEERLGRQVDISEITQGIMQLILYGLVKEEGAGRYRRE